MYYTVNTFVRKTKKRQRKRQEKKPTEIAEIGQHDLLSLKASCVFNRFKSKP